MLTNFAELTVCRCNAKRMCKADDKFSGRDKSSLLSITLIVLTAMHRQTEVNFSPEIWRYSVRSREAANFSTIFWSTLFLSADSLVI